MLYEKKIAFEKGLTSFAEVRSVREMFLFLGIFLPSFVIFTNDIQGVQTEKYMEVT